MSCASLAGLAVFVPLLISCGGEEIDNCEEIAQIVCFYACECASGDGSVCTVSYDPPPGETEPGLFTTGNFAMCKALWRNQVCGLGGEVDVGTCDGQMSIASCSPEGDRVEVASECLPF